MNLSFSHHKNEISLMRLWGKIIVGPICRNYAENQVGLLNISVCEMATFLFSVSLMVGKIGGTRNMSSFVRAMVRPVDSFELNGFVIAAAGN